MQTVRTRIFAYLLSSALIIAIKEKKEVMYYIVFKYNHWKQTLKGDKEVLYSKIYQKRKKKSILLQSKYLF